MNNKTFAQNLNWAIKKGKTGVTAQVAKRELQDFVDKYAEGGVAEFSPSEIDTKEVTPEVLKLAKKFSGVKKGNPDFLGLMNDIRINSVKSTEVKTNGSSSKVGQEW